jgi:hypothetical protein
MTMLTKRTTTIETLDENTVNVGGHEIACTWNADGDPCVNVEQMQQLRDDGNANWSDDEMQDLIYHAEVRMIETYRRPVCQIEGHRVEIRKTYNDRYEVGVDGILEGIHDTADQAIFAAREQVRMIDGGAGDQPAAPEPFCHAVRNL